MIIYTLISLFISFCVSADILIIGDSHTTGPFGKILHKNLTEKLNNEIILTYGHSSSAPIHWMSNKPTKLSGGINHHFGQNGIYYSHPNLPDWREKQNSLSLLNLLNNPVVHKQWREKLTREINLDTIVIALGANDRNIVSTLNGDRSSAYESRVKTLRKMLSEIKKRNLKCIWIAPPSSPLRPSKVEETTFNYLKDGIEDNCPIYDSRKFVANFCDKVHFSCKEGYSRAKMWADEVTEFVLSNL